MNKRFKKITSLFVAGAVMSAALISNASVIFAGGDTLPPKTGEQGYKGENQPGYHGYRNQSILDWTPEQDKYNEFMRAKVPLQDRNAAFAATQANPKLDQNVKALSLAGDYGNTFFEPWIYNDQFSANLFNFWQYEDIYASWHGVVTDPTPDNLYVADAPWTERKYEFGILNIPNPAYTNAAHKNGVMSIGCLFFPRNEHPKESIYTDANGRFPIADKLVEMAKFYGFDGYFINAEEEVPADFMPTYAAFMKAMTDQGMYIQVYASNPYGQENQDKWGGIEYYNKDASVFSNWIKKPGDKTVSGSSLYMNPGPSKEQVDGSVKIMASLGLDAKQTVFNTLEAGQTGFSGTRGSLYNILDKNLVPRTAIASLGNTTSWEHLDEQMFGHTGDNKYTENRRGDPAYQKYVAARERTWWTGSLNQPYYTNSDDYVQKGVTFLDKNSTKYTEAERKQLQEAVLNAQTNPYITANDPNRGTKDGTHPVQGEFQSWPGMAAFISERSVVDGTNFYTNFNTGHGMEYYVDGKVSNAHEWSNINIQDILPTWQWWIDAVGKSAPLKVDFDYGTKYDSAFPITKVGGYNGGSSLVVKGDLISKNFLRLYKTDMDVNANSKFSITYNKTKANDTSEMQIGVILKDDPTNVRYLPVPDSGKRTNGWATKTIDLSEFAGKKIAGFGLAFIPHEKSVTGYQMNIGEIKITDNSVTAPSAPKGLKIDRAFDTGEMYISWDIADYDLVQQYNVYATIGGSDVYLGGTYDSVYYIKSLYESTGNVQIKVTAVGKDGTESKAAAVSVNPTQKISDISVRESAGFLDLRWKNPNVGYNSIKADVSLDYSNNAKKSFTRTIAKGETSSRMLVPAADGNSYTLRMSLLDANGKVISSTDSSGELDDKYSAPYVGTAKFTDGEIRLSQPESYDWWHIYVSQNGKQLTKSGDDNFRYRGSDLAFPVDGNNGTVQVTLEDFAGNMSKTVSVPYFKDPNAAISSAIFPDPAVLAKVKAASPNIAGLSKITSLDLSGTAVSDLTGMSLLQNLKTLNLSNCKNLTAVDGLSSNIALSEVNISGCSELRAINLAGSGVEKIDYGKVETFGKLVSLDLSGARLDMTPGTAERYFADMMAKQVAGKADFSVHHSYLSNIGTNVVNGSMSGAKKMPFTDETFKAMFDNGNSSNAHIGNVKVDGATTIDYELAAPIKVEGFSVFGSEQTRSLANFAMYYSIDGKNYLPLGKAVKGNTEKIYSQTVSGVPAAKYFRLVGSKGTVMENLYVAEIQLMGYGDTIYKSGVKYDNQRPECYKVIPKTAQMKQGSGIVRVNTLLGGKTVRGNNFASLAKASFIDPSYNIEKVLDDKSLFIAVKDQSGVTTANAIDTAKNGTYTATVTTYNSANESGDKLGTITVTVK